MEHTPLTFGPGPIADSAVIRHKGRDIINIYSPNVGNPEGIAREIVQAVNSHDVLEKTRLTLEGLTPGGSEYANDPERCEVYIRERFDAGHQAKKDAVRLKRTNDALVKLVAMALAEWHADDSNIDREEPAHIKAIRESPLEKIIRQAALKLSKDTTP